MRQHLSIPPRRTIDIEYADVHGPEATHESTKGEAQSTLNVVAYFLMKV